MDRGRRRSVRGGHNMRGQYFTAHGKVNGRDPAAEAAETLERIRRRREELEAASGMPADPDVVKISTAARIAGVTVNKIRSWVKVGSCPIAARFGSVALVSLARVKQIRDRKADKRRKVRAKKKRKKLELEKRRESGERVEYFSEYYAENREAILRTKRAYTKRKKAEAKRALRLSKQTN